jgi:uncharacterized protein (DUF302 family)
MNIDHIEGLTTVPSEVGPDETMSRLEKEIRAQGMRVFVRINHAALAAEARLTLRPTEVIIFGNPRAGTPLMQAAQTTGIDLPLKALVWQDEASRTWLSYNKPACLAKRHALEDADRVTGQMELMLEAIALKATSNSP